jgi:amino acid adenylation domain-containing protein
VALGGEVIGDIRAAGRSAGVSPAMLVHAALAVVLHRYGLGERIGIGTPLSLRDHPAVGFDAVGLFLNVLPVVVPVASDDRLSDVAGRARRALIDVHPHKFVALTDLAGMAGVAREDLFVSADTAFGLTLAVHGSRASGDGPGVTIGTTPSTSPGARTHVDVTIDVGGGRIVVAWQHGVLMWPSAERLVDDLLAVLRCFRTDPDCTVARVGLSPVAPDMMGAPGVGDLVPRDVYEPIATAVRRVASGNSDEVAIVDRGTVWRFHDLCRTVDAIRHRFRGYGLRAGARVAVGYGQSCWQIASALAAWDEGLCYVPVDPAGPVDRLRFVLDDAQADLLLATTDGAPGMNCRVGDIRDVALTREPIPDSPDGGQPSSDDIAYVMYTSGSSGRPKGVAVTHGNLAAFMDAITSALPESGRGAWLAETAPTFDISLLEMFWPLLNGQPVVVDDPYRDAVAAETPSPIVHRQCTPSRARQVLTARELGQAIGHGHVEPRTWLLGGEVLPAVLLRDLRSAYPATTFLNMYGPTEATIWSTAHPVTGDEVDEVPLGRPLTNTLLSIVDETGQAVPPGVVGELTIAGSSVAAGYLNQPGLSDQVFGTIVTGGITLTAYRTGDRVVVGPDGHLYFRGRRDGQIKIRGHRVELAEIESAISTDPTVADAVVTYLESDGGSTSGGSLAAVVTPRPGHVVDPDSVRDRLSQLLPPVMIPDRFRVTGSIPTLASGKADRVSVRALASAPVQERAFQASPASSTFGRGTDDRSDLPHILAEVASAVVGRPVGADDDFFAVGGNSINVLEFLAGLHERGLEVQLRDVFQHRTTRLLAPCARAVRPWSP